MDQVKMDGKPARERILVSPQERDVKGIKMCLEVARFLRESGYHTELNLGHKAMSGYRWVISLLGEGSFQLIDLATGGKSELATTTEILEMLRGAR